MLTNAHVVNGVDRVKVRTADKQEYEGRVIGISQDTDVAVVRVTGLQDFKPLELERTKRAELGDDILALGSPLGLENTVTKGIISGVDRDFEIDPYSYKKVYQISAPITHGNSGGPLIDGKTGKVLGINSAGTSEGVIGFSIPIANIIDLAESWSEQPMTDLQTDVSNNEPDYTATDEGMPDDTDGVGITENASGLLNYYYDCINKGDYVTAYSMLGSKWQEGTSYDDYRSGFINTKSVSVDDINATKEDEESASVRVFITAEERRNGKTKYRKYELIYKVGYENDQLTIISGNGVSK